MRSAELPKGDVSSKISGWSVEAGRCEIAAAHGAARLRKGALAGFARVEITLIKVHQGVSRLVKDRPVRIVECGVRNCGRGFQFQNFRLVRGGRSLRDCCGSRSRAPSERGARRVRTRGDHAGSDVHRGSSRRIKAGKG